jgi:hypothetical protein
MAKRSHSRRVVQIYDQASAVGGALDTGVLDVEMFDALIVEAVLTAGAGPSGALTGFMIREDNSQGQFFTGTVAAGAGIFTPSIGEDVNAVAPGIPVPRRIQFTLAALAAMAVRLTITGVSKRRGGDML